MLPSQSVSKALAELYFDRFEITHRILHGPTFWKDFDNVWDDPTKSNPAFLTILLLVILIADTILPVNWMQNAGLKRPAMELPAVIIATCEAWLSKQTKKYLTIELFQVRVLIHVAKQMRCIQLKQTWTSTGGLLRFAMAAGLHRDPSLLDSMISPYHQEMRRRLWSTIMELDLQASLDRGMPSSIGDQFWDCPTPTNCEDEAFDETVQKLPSSKAKQVFSTGSFMHISQQTIRLRSEMCSVLNDTVSSPSHIEVLEYERRVMTLLQELPSWDTEQSKAVRAMLDIQLRQYLLLLHFRFLQTSTSHAQRSYSTFACANAALSVLGSYQDLGVAEYFAFSLLSVGGVMRPALALCQTLSTSSVSSGLSVRSDLQQHRC